MGVKVNLEGRRFGRLTVTERSPSGLWVCRCDCGGTTYAKTYDLTGKRVQSCGCTHHDVSSKKDLAGMRFGRLTVMRYSGQGQWLCRCDCGVEKNVHRCNLKNGSTVSCGCRRKEHAAALNKGKKR